MTSYPTPWEKAGKTLTAIRQLGSIRNCLRLNCRSACLTGEQNPACHSDFLPPSNPYRPLELQSSARNSAVQCSKVQDLTGCVQIVQAVQSLRSVQAVR